MSGAAPVPAGLVVYAKDLARVANFYEQTLALPCVETEADFVVFARGGVELVIVRIPDAIASRIHLASPAVIREETPLKATFLVDDLERVRVAAAATGGGTRPLATAWRWRGQLHLDGRDPEGNVVQFRQADG